MWSGLCLPLLPHCKGLRTVKAAVSLTPLKATTNGTLSSSLFLVHAGIIIDSLGRCAKLRQGRRFNCRSCAHLYFGKQFTFMCCDLKSSVTLQQCYQVLKLRNRTSKDRKKKSWFISPSVTVFLSSHLINARGQKSGNSLCLLGCAVCFSLYSLYCWLLPLKNKMWL